MSKEFLPTLFTVTLIHKTMIHLLKNGLDNSYGIAIVFRQTVLLV